MMAKDRVPKIMDDSPKSSSCPPQLRGVLAKKSPSVFFGKFQVRFFAVADGKLYWWKTAQDANTKGIDGCKGFVDFAVNACEIGIEEDCETRFWVRPSARRWSQGNFTGADSDRVFDFDASDSDHSRDTWVSAICSHMTYATTSPTRCFISDLPHSYRDGSLKAHFSGFEGLVEDSVVLLVLDGGKLTAEITFVDQNIALAVANDSHELNGKQVKVKNKAATISVTNLPSPYNDGMLTDYFKTFGSIASSATLKTDGGRLIAYLNFDVGGVAAKVARDTHKLEDEPLQIKLCFPPAGAPDIHYESQENIKRERDRVADDLALKGFSVSWLLGFWRKYGPRPEPEDITVRTLQAADGAWNGTITKSTTTNTVVRDIVIPETAAEKCCYMDLKAGTATTPGKLVSHWWGASFYGDVLCVIQDATGLSGYELDWFVNYGHVEGSTPPNDAVMNSGYWMCIFGVNQHVSICGVCNDCDVVNTTKHCRICNRKIYNPCPCGSPKYKSGHVFCQMDKFDKVMEKMTKGLAVALDAELVTTSRVWVVSEIGKSLDRNLPISWRMPNDVDKRFCTAETPEILSVLDCNASLQADKDMILKQIRESVGIEAFDSKVSAALLPTITNFALWKVINDNEPAKLVDSILKRQGNANYVGAMQRSVLFAAAQKGAHDVVVSLLQHRASASLDRQDSVGFTPVLFASHEGHDSVVAALCSAKADIDRANNKGFTPVLIASQNGHDSVVAALCSAKADIDRANNEGFTPVQIASQQGHDSVVAALCSAKAHIDRANNNGATPLFMSVVNGRQGTVQLLLDAKADTDCSWKGQSILYKAVQKGHEKIVQVLLAAKVAVDSPGPNGVTPLNKAADEGHAAIVTMLVSKRANLETKDTWGDTALGSAKKKGHSRVMDILKAAGAKEKKGWFG